MDAGNWKEKAKYRDGWRSSLGEAKARLTELFCKYGNEGCLFYRSNVNFTLE